MMMNYHSKDKRKKTSKWLFAFMLVVTIFFYSQILNIFSGLFKIIIYPVWIVENNISENTINPFSFLTSKKALLVSNKQLEDDLSKIKMQLFNKNILLKENLELKEIMGRSSHLNNFILASVLNKPNNSEYDTLIIDIGKNFNIKKGDKVLALGDIILGEVSSVEENTSKIKLYSSSKEKIDVMVGLFNIEATAVGKGGGNFEIKIPRGADVEIGDTVASVGLNAPVFGSVEEIISTPRDSFKTLLFKSPVNLFELKWVQILKSE